VTVQLAASQEGLNSVSKLSHILIYISVYDRHTDRTCAYSKEEDNLSHDLRSLIYILCSMT
jgi:hypothetical protein